MPKNLARRAARFAAAAVRNPAWAVRRLGERRQRWLADRALDRLIVAVRAGREAGDASLFADAAATAAAEHRFARAEALYDLADELSDGDLAVLAARRRLPGYVGAVPPPIVARAADAALARVGHGAGRRRTRLAATPIHKGSGLTVDAIVRYTLDDPGTTMVRKTMRGATPREVAMYRSGLLDDGGRWWRAPRCYHVEEAPPGHWHLFLEDLGDVTREKSPGENRRAATATGELNGRHVGDASLAVRFPWLVEDVTTRLRFVNPAWAARRLAGSVDDALAARVTRTLEALVAAEPALVRRNDALPTTLCHIDANLGNVTERGDRVVLFDWNTCRLGPVGSDLGYLLGWSNAAVLDDPDLLAECLDAYTAGLAAGGAPDVAPEDVALGFRHRYIAHALRQQIHRLPGPEPGGTPAWRLERRTSNLSRLCDEAALLLDSQSI